MATPGAANVNGPKTTAAALAATEVVGVLEDATVALGFSLRSARRALDKLSIDSDAARSTAALQELIDMSSTFEKVQREAVALLCSLPTKVSSKVGSTMDVGCSGGPLDTLESKLSAQRSGSESSAYQTQRYDDEQLAIVSEESLDADREMAFLESEEDYEPAASEGTRKEATPTTSLLSMARRGNDRPDKQQASNEDESKEVKPKKNSFVFLSQRASAVGVPAVLFRPSETRKSFTKKLLIRKNGVDDALKKKNDEALTSSVADKSTIGPSRSRKFSFGLQKHDEDAQSERGEAPQPIGSTDLNEMLHGLGRLTSGSAVLGPLAEMLVLLLAKVYVVVMTPLYLCFRFSQPLPLGLAVLNTMAETVLAIEIAAKWHVGEHQDESRKLTARSRIMEFVLFVLYSGSPVWTLQLILENLVFTTRRNRRIARLFAFAPCLKVVQLVHFIYSALQSKAVFKENIANKRVTFDPILFRISKLVAFFLCALHYVGCVYHYVGQIADDEDEVPTSGEGEIDWVYYAANGTREPVLQRWAQAYYWASMAVLGNYMKPKNIVQTTFSTVAVLIGIFTTATITGSVTSLLANADVVAAQQRQKRSRIRNYLRQNRVPELLGQKIHAYYDYLWQSKSLPSDDDLFADLSDTLKLKLALAVKRKFILSCPLFRDLDPYSIVNLVQRLVPKVCEPDQVIMAEGEGGTTMFFVIRGQLAVSIVEAKSKSRIQVAVLKAGDHFGETAIVTPGGKRTATIKALTFCELYMLTKQAFVEAGKSNTKFSRAVRLALHQRDVGRELSKKLRRAKCKLMAFGAFLGAVGSRSDKRKRPPTALLAYHSFSKATTTTRGPRISWRFNLSLSGSDSGSFMRRQLTKSRRRQRVVAPAAAADEEIVPPDDVTSEPSPPPHDEGENDDVVVEPTICSVGSTSKDDDDITETDDETDDISNDERCMTPPLP